MSENFTRKIEVANEILSLSRNTLLVNLRFLDSAISRLDFIPVFKSTLQTDGEHIYYDPNTVLERFKEDKNICVRDYLHLVFHCIFRHMWINMDTNREIWDLACDIAVENVITELNIKNLEVEREKDQEGYIYELKDSMRSITAEKVYKYLSENKFTKKDILKMKQAFSPDSHECWWSVTEPENTQEGTGNIQESTQEIRISGVNKVDLEQDWKDVSERMQIEVEMFQNRHGNTGGDLTQNLLEVNREKYDYTEFLKKFAVRGEAMKINDDEFDYIFYTYGLQMYKKIPLIEPLEYKEVKKIKEFVIAIDTSGSTSGELVQKFLQKTYNILLSKQSFFSKINVHIIQCDSEIQEDVKITGKEDFEQYIKTMKIRGLGGTDFRPVFEYVDMLRKNGELINMKGMIYFTDGYGDFPSKKPDYETAFIYIDDEYNNPYVPPWAMKLVLRKEEI